MTKGYSENNRPMMLAILFIIDGYFYAFVHSFVGIVPLTLTFLEITTFPLVVYIFLTEFYFLVKNKK